MFMQCDTRHREGLLVMPHACASADGQVQEAGALHDGLHIAVGQQPPQPRHVLLLRPMNQRDRDLQHATRQMVMRYWA